MKSINTFADHAPKPDWVKNFFASGNDFLTDSGLGPMQISMFKRFLSDSSLIEKTRTTSFFNFILRIGWESSTAWGLILIQLAYANPQIRWYIDNMPIGEQFPRAYLTNKIMEEGVSAKDAASIVKSFRRLIELPLGTVLNFGTVETTGNRIESLTRTKMSSIDPRVLLYSLYRYAKECGDYYQFTLDTLMDTHIQSKGISPVKIFGLTRDEMEAMLRGLAAQQNAYIDVTFTHDLDKITLRDYYSPESVLELF